MGGLPARERERQQRDGAERDRDERRALAILPDQQPRQRRHDEIELLLDGERPGVQQWLVRRGLVEIAGLAPEQEVEAKRKTETALRPRSSMAGGSSTNQPAIADTKTVA